MTRGAANNVCRQAWTRPWLELWMAWADGSSGAAVPGWTTPRPISEEATQASLPLASSERDRGKGPRSCSPLPGARLALRIVTGPIAHVFGRPAGPGTQDTHSHPGKSMPLRPRHSTKGARDVRHAPIPVPSCVEIPSRERERERERVEWALLARPIYTPLGIHYTLNRGCRTGERQKERKKGEGPIQLLS